MASVQWSAANITPFPCSAGILPAVARPSWPASVAETAPLQPPGRRRYRTSPIPAASHCSLKIFLQIHPVVQAGHLIAVSVEHQGGPLVELAEASFGAWLGVGPTLGFTLE